MADVLSQSEVESLLAALDPGAQGGQGGNAFRSDSDQLQISVYDFKRPERVSKEQIRAFHGLHESFSREFGANLSGMLRTIIEVKLISVDQLTYSEFVFSLENPTCFNLLFSDGLDGHLILDLNPSIIYPIVDRLLGGGRDVPWNYPTRPMTEIEWRIVSRITKLAMDGLERAWLNIAELKLRTAQTESNPQLVQIVPPNEVIVLISFEITMGEIRGIMNLCIPFNTIEPLTGKLTSDSWSAYTRKAADPVQRLHLEANVARAPVEMVVYLAGIKIRAQELMNLEIGDVILTEAPTTSGIDVQIEGRPMFRGMPGKLKGHKAVRITEIVQRARDAIDRKIRGDAA